MPRTPRPLRPVRGLAGSTRRPRLNHRDAILLLVALFFAQGLARADSGTDLPGAGMLEFAGGAAAHLATEVEMAVSGIVAEVTVRQRFRNDGDGWLEGVYAFPLPEDAAVTKMVLEIGDRRIEGEIREREAARRTYEAARAEGRRTSLVSQARPNVFTTRVANVGPGEEVAVTLRYVEEIDYHDERFSLRFPMTITPRYGDAGAAAPADHAPGTVRVSVELRPGVPVAWVEAPHHEIAVQQGPEGYQITLADGGVIPNRDFELAWAPVLGKAPRAALMSERYGDDTYGLLMLLPVQAEYRSVPPRELILVIDTSGSMGGAPIGQARESLEMAVASLRPEDRFNVIAFDTGVAQLFDAPVAASNANVGRALTWIADLEADGGTEMAPALAAATRGRAPDGHVRQIVFITDGAVAGERQLFAQIARDLGDARLFTVGIGAAPNTYFMRKAAEFGRGSYSYIGSADQVSERMDALLSRLEYPVVTDLCVDWPGMTEAYPSQLPDLYLGEPLVVAVRLPKGKSGPIGVCGKLEGGFWEEQLDPGTAHEGFAVSTLWARRKVEGLMDDLVLGADPAAVRHEVIQLGLAHHLITRYTSLVAVDQTPAATAQARRSRANFGSPTPEGAIGVGSAQLTLLVPQTDAGTVMRATLGLMLALLGWIVARRLRDLS